MLAEPMNISLYVVSFEFPYIQFFSALPFFPREKKVPADDEVR